MATRYPAATAKRETIGRELRRRLGMLTFPLRAAEGCTATRKLCVFLPTSVYTRTRRDDKSGPGRLVPTDAIGSPALSPSNPFRNPPPPGLVSSRPHLGGQMSPEAPVFARSASTIRRTRTPLRLLVIGLSLVMAATFGPHRGHRRRSGTLRRRAVPRQGDLADAAHDAGAEGRPALRHRGGRSRRHHGQRRGEGRQPAAVRRRHAGPGDREVPARRRHLLLDPGGLHRLRQRRQHRRPGAGGHAVQRPADRRAGAAGPHPAADLGRPGGRRARRPVPRPGDPDARQHGARRGSLDPGRLRLGEGDRRGARSRSA